MQEDFPQERRDQCWDSASYIPFVHSSLLGGVSGISPIPHHILAKASRHQSSSAAIPTLILLWFYYYYYLFTRWFCL